MMSKMEGTSSTAGCPSHPPATSLQDAREGEAPAEPRDIGVTAMVQTVGLTPSG